MFKNPTHIQIGFILTSATVFLCTPFFVHADIVITEIMYDLPGSDAGREWIEVYNDADAPVDLGTSVFFEADTNHGITGDDTLLPAGGYAIIADKPSGFLADQAHFTGLLLDSSFSLSNEGESLSMKDPDGAETDSVLYTSTWGAAGDGHSLQRRGSEWLAAPPTPGGAYGEDTENEPDDNEDNEDPDSTDSEDEDTTDTEGSADEDADEDTTATTTDSGEESADEGESTDNEQHNDEAEPSEEDETLPAPLYDIVITEIMYDLSGSDSGREWIEVFNDDTVSVDLSTWRLFENGVHHTLTYVRGPSRLSPGAYGVIVDDSTAFSEDISTNVSVFESSFSLSNEEEELSLRNEESEESDAVHYRSDWGALGDGHSLQRVGAVWSVGIPTAGARNTHEQYPPPEPEEEPEERAEKKTDDDDEEEDVSEDTPNDTAEEAENDELQTQSAQKAPAAISGRAREEGLFSGNATGLVKPRVDEKEVSSTGRTSKDAEDAAFATATQGFQAAAATGIGAAEKESSLKWYAALGAVLLVAGVGTFLMGREHKEKSDVKNIADTIEIVE